MLLDYIEHKPDERLAVVAQLIMSEKPVVLYGAGVRAASMTHFLSKYGISVHCYCVDAEYFIEGTTFNDKKVTTFNALSREGLDYVILIAFQDYKKASEFMRNNPTGKKAWYIDDPYDFFKLDYEFVLQNSHAFEETFNNLVDELSKNILVAYINSRITGDPKKIYELRSSEDRQYDYALLNIGEDEVFVDCGAFNGDTIASFLEYTGKKCRKIIAFEPDDNNYNSIMNNIHNVELTLINKGVWDKEAVLRFYSGKTTASSFNECDTGIMSEYVDDAGNCVMVPVTSIDEVLKGEKATFIKMDIEGSELMALRGAKETIRKHYPKMAICVYHRVDDLITIPQYIMSLIIDGGMRYRFYLRHHCVSMAETVLYAIPS